MDQKCSQSRGSDRSAKPLEKNWSMKKVKLSDKKPFPKRPILSYKNTIVHEIEIVE